MRFLILGQLLLGFHTRSLGAQSAAEPDHFDYYLLNLSWSPEFCATLASSPQCIAHPGFVSGPTNPAAWLDITPDLSLISHEWTKHGTCTLLSGDEYFAQARTAFHSVTIPPLFTKLDHELAMKPDAIVNPFVEVDPSLSRAN
jgi:ribonuclease T2